MKTLSLLMLSFILLAGCVPTTSGASSPTQTTPALPTEVVGTPAPTETLVPAENTPTAAAVQLPVDLTPAQRAAIQDLAKQKDIPLEQIKVISTEAVTWPDGCLGIVIPGVMCTQMVVDGYRIVLMADGKQFEYHTNLDGTNVIAANQQLTSIKLVVSTSDHTIKLVDPNFPLGPTYNPAFNGFLPTGGSIAGTAYVQYFTDQAKAVALDAQGTRNLSFIQNPNYGLAIWRGGLGTQPRLAWGTGPTGDTQSSSLQISAPDGSHLETLLTQDTSSSSPIQLVAELWSGDGQSLYFSKEPVGIGGYILFSGASSLYQIDIATKQVSELIPFESSSGPMVCLDSISGDYRFVADHCSNKSITIRDLTNGETSTIQPPVEVSDFRVLGSARFSPDGSRLAFALAKGDPDNEQGWVAVSEGTSGGSKLILTSPAGAYDTVVGWLDDQTLLVQTNYIQCNPACENQLWTVSADGSNPQKVADGNFLAVIDNQ